MISVEITNLYTRRTQMNATIDELKTAIERNNLVIELVNKRTEEQEKKYKLSEFTKTCEEQNDSLKRQIAKLQQMVDDTGRVIDMIEKDGDKYTKFANTLLDSFGYKPEEIKEEKKDA